jgi:hypothetical protein
VEGCIYLKWIGLKMEQIKIDNITIQYIKSLGKERNEKNLV